MSRFLSKCGFCSIMDLLAPAAGKSLSCGQLIRITGISPLRGSLRAVSGSTIIILAVMADIGSCRMVSEGILAQPLLFQEGRRVPHRWLSPGLMSQCLLIQFSRFRWGLRKNPSTIYEMGRPKMASPKSNFFEKLCFLSQDGDSKAFFSAFPYSVLKRSLYYIWIFRGSFWTHFVKLFQKNLLLSSKHDLKALFCFTRSLWEKVPLLYMNREKPF